MELEKIMSNEKSKSEMFGADISVALSGLIEADVLINQLFALGVEYQLGNLKPERFAKRTHELLVAYQKGGTKSPTAPAQPVPESKP